MQIKILAEDPVQTTMMVLNLSWYLVLFVYWSKNKRITCYMWILNPILNMDFSIDKFSLFIKMNKLRYREIFFYFYQINKIKPFTTEEVNIERILAGQWSHRRKNNLAS